VASPTQDEVKPVFIQQQENRREQRSLQEPLSPDLICLGALQLSGFDFLDTANYDKWFSKDSTMELAPAGIYYGTDGIRDYVNFIYGPYFTKYREAGPRQYKVLSATSTECEVLIAGVSQANLNATTTKGGSAQLSVGYSLLYDYTYTGPASALVTIKKTNVYSAEPFVSWFFTDQLDSSQTTEFFCKSLETSCPVVYKRNEFNNRNMYTSKSSKKKTNVKSGAKVCVEAFDELPLVEEGGNVRAYSQGCRKLHVSFAVVNVDHCPHISFIPIVDKNGSIKCQAESDNERTYDDMFSKESLNFMKSVAMQHFNDTIIFKELSSGQMTGSKGKKGKRSG